MEATGSPLLRRHKSEVYFGGLFGGSTDFSRTVQAQTLWHNNGSTERNSVKKTHILSQSMSKMSTQYSLQESTS